MKNAIFVISVLASSLFAGAVLAKEVKDVVPEVVKAAALAKPIARPAITHQSPKLPKRERSLIKIEGDANGDWNEF